MKYTPRIHTLEAAPVELAGQRLYAVAVDGKAHLIDGVNFSVLALGMARKKLIVRREDPATHLDK